MCILQRLILGVWGGRWRGGGDGGGGEEKRYKEPESIKSVHEEKSKRLMPDTFNLKIV